MPDSALEIAGLLTDRRVIVTGGLGFLGSNLARLVAGAGARVTIVDSLLPRAGGNRMNLEGVEGAIELLVGDVRDEEMMRGVVAGADVVFSLAGQPGHLDSMVEPYADLEHNCRGPLAVLEACRHSAPEARIVFASTRQIYGHPDYTPVDENHPVRPPDVNAVNKFAAESFHRLYGEVYGTSVCILRLTNTFGPRMRIKDDRQNFLGWWIRLLLEGRVIEVYGDGTQARDLTFVDDAIRAFLLAATCPEAGGEVFNIGDARGTTMLELAGMLVGGGRRGSFKLVPFPEERSSIDIGNYRTDITKIRSNLGWEPLIPLELALDRTVAYFADHADWYL